MSTGAPTTAQPAASLCGQLVTLLNLLYGRARGYGRAVVGRGTGLREFRIPAGVDVAFVPAWLLAELEYLTPDTIRLAPCTFGNSAAEILDQSAAFVSIDIAPQFASTPSGWRWVPADGAFAAARAKLAAFPVAPPVVVVAGWSLHAFWPLAQPLRLDDAGERSRAIALQRDLAGALSDQDAVVTVPSGPTVLTVDTESNGRTAQRSAGSQHVPAWMPTWPALPMPGSFDSTVPSEPRPVFFETCHSSRVDLEALEAALASSAAPSRSRTRKVTS